MVRILDFFVFVFYKASTTKKSIWNYKIGGQTQEENTRISFTVTFSLFLTPAIILIIGRITYIKNILNNAFIFMLLYLISAAFIYVILSRKYTIERIKYICQRDSGNLANISPKKMRFIIFIFWMVLFFYFTNKIIDVLSD